MVRCVQWSQAVGPKVGDSAMDRGCGEVLDIVKKC